MDEICTRCEHPLSYHNAAGCGIEQCGCMADRREARKPLPAEAAPLPPQGWGGEVVGLNRGLRSTTSESGQAPQATRAGWQHSGSDPRGVARTAVDAAAGDRRMDEGAQARRQGGARRADHRRACSARRQGRAAPATCCRDRKSSRINATLERSPMTPASRWTIDARKLLASLVQTEPRIIPQQVREIGRLLNRASQLRQFQRARSVRRGRRA